MPDEMLICGGGLTGLSLAALAAERGIGCTVLEKSEHLGGRARSQTLGDSLFNLGPHALYLGGPAQRVLASFGLPLTGRAPNTSGLGLRNGTLHTLPAGPFTLLTSTLIPTREKPQLAALLARFASLDAEPLKGTTAGQWLRDVLPGPAARDLLGMLMRVSTYSHAPELLDASYALRQVQRALKPGVRYLDGGWQTLVDGAAKVATARGVTILPGTRAQRVHRDANGFEVTLADGSTRRAKIVVLAVDPHTAAGLFPDGPGHHTLRDWASASVPSRAACLDLALSSLPRPRSTLAFGVDVPLYASVHSASASLGGSVVIQLGRYLAPGEAGAGADVALEQLLDGWQPGWREKVQARRFLPEMTVAHALPLASMRGGRPSTTAVPGVDGLYTVGDHVDSGWMLADGALASAEQVVAAITAGGRAAA